MLRVKRTLLAAGLILAWPWFNYAQRRTAADHPEFEVATVKTSPPPQGDLININLGGFRNGVLTFTNASLSDCLKFAYDLVSDVQLSGPAWITSKQVRFDIVAKAVPETPRDQLRVMLQMLLAERLEVSVHSEKRDLPYLALIAGKGGPKLRPSATPGQPNGVSVPGHISGPAMPIGTLALLLSRFERQTVINMTGLDRPFEVNLEWTPDRIQPPLPGDENRIPGPDGPSIFTAVLEQLGLKLETRKGPLDVLIVDHAEQTPSEN